MTQTVSLQLGGREFSIEMGRLAKQADGAALVQCGDTVVLVTACGDTEERENVDFLPLTCDYREYTYAAGRIPGGFFKREGRPTEKEVLVSRLIDRPLRPLFPEGYHCETQVVAMVLSAEADINPDILALNGASAALYASTIPFFHPLGAVRVGLVNDRLVINPSLEEMEEHRVAFVDGAQERGIDEQTASDDPARRVRRVRNNGSRISSRLASTACASVAISSR